MTTVVYRAPREWTRTHPVSPLLRGWAIIGLVAAYALHDVVPEMLTGGTDEAFELADRFPLLWLLLSAAAVLAAVLALAYWGWSRTEYRIGDDTVYLRTGILNKQEKQARLDRLQAVDLVQPLLARIFGFAGVNVQVAGGADSGFDLSFLRLGDAEALRNEILFLAAGLKKAPTGDDAAVAPGADAPGADAPGAEASGAEAPGEGRLGQLREHARERADALSHPDQILHGTERFDTEVAAAEERRVYALPLGRLLGSLALSWATVVVLLVPVGLVVGAAIASIGVADAAGRVVSTVLAGGAGAIAAVLAVVGFFWTRINGGYGFAAAISADGLRLRHGLLETRRQTVPPGRVQAVSLSRPFLWSRTDWWTVRMNVAGYEGEDENVTVLHPVASRDEALRAVWLVLPDIGDEDPAGTIGLAMTGTGTEGGFLGSPRSVRWINPWQWRHRGVRATDRALLIRRGRWSREVVIVPHERTQSLALEEGPVGRRLGIADVTIHSTGGPVSPRAANLAVDDAMALLDAQAERARQGRRRQTTEQWMRAVGLAPATPERATEENR